MPYDIHRFLDAQTGDNPMSFLHITTLEKEFQRCLKDMPSWEELLTFLRPFAYLDRKVWGRKRNFVPAQCAFDVGRLFNHLIICPGLQFLAFRDGTLTAMLSLLRVREEYLQKAASWEELTETGSLLSHDPEGDIIFAARLSIDPAAKEAKFPQALINIPFRETVSRNGARAACIASEADPRQIAFFEQEEFSVVRKVQDFLPGGGNNPNARRRDAVLMTRRSPAFV